MVRRRTLLDIQAKPFTFDCCGNEKFVEVQFETSSPSARKRPIVSIFNFKSLQLCETNNKGDRRPQIRARR